MSLDVCYDVHDSLGMRLPRCNQKAFPSLLDTKGKSLCLMPKVPKVSRTVTHGSQSNDSVGYGVLIADYNCIIHPISAPVPSYEAQAEAIQARVQIYHLLFSHSKSVTESLTNRWEQPNIIVDCQPLSLERTFNNNEPVI